MEFKINSNIYKTFLWVLLVLVLINDVIVHSLVFLEQSKSFAFLENMAIFLGLFIKLGILYGLIKSKGPIKELIYIWGGLFILSGTFRIFAFMVSTETEPLQDYIDSSIKTLIGVLLVFPAMKYIVYVNNDED